MEHYLEKGYKNYGRRAIVVNSSTSRSYSVFTITIEATATNETNAAMVGGGEVEVQRGRCRVAKLELVDMDGSERLPWPHNLGQSLSPFSLVMNALNSPNSTHIPYRYIYPSVK